MNQDTIFDADTRTKLEQIRWVEQAIAERRNLLQNNADLQAEVARLRAELDEARDLLFAYRDENAEWRKSVTAYLVKQ